eukprot:4199806-Lingulodinium_polyedra.AAC.1
MVGGLWQCLGGSVGRQRPLARSDGLRKPKRATVCTDMLPPWRRGPAGTKRCVGLGGRAAGSW